MYCDKCGAVVQDGQQFCHACGKAFPMAPAASASSGVGRVLSHTRIVGALWIVFSILHLIPGLGILAFGTAGLPFVHHVPRVFFLGPLLGLIGGLMTLSSVLGIVAGWGLLSRCSWARMLTVVLACFALLNIPFGTLLGAYTLWVLLGAESEREYERLCTN